MTTLKGADASGDDLNIESNRTDSFSKIQLLGDGDIRFNHGSNDEITVYNGNTEYFSIQATSGYYHFEIKETGTSPSAHSGYGQFYTKADNNLYFRDGDGVEHTVAYA